ncbi:cell wall hydrolase [Pseudomonas sp. SED1]|uniref:cell wall hydrolase n=1 Tax=Pseudomonas sp. SED1 TaxID=3056845 RepID=UPI00296FC99C|nr:cell wall hydrolase [Pseudomonas sp. SED1]MDY0834174.1 cell wall hydrolase [Pseudomonas sp. SED1]
MALSLLFENSMTMQSALLCLALNIYHESRGEPIAGQVAVAMVTMNRAQWDTREVCPVVYAERQFSWTRKANKQAPKERAAWARAQKIADRVIKGKHEDKTRGATYFHERTVKPVWRHSLKRTTTIGRHIFYAER